MSRLIRNNKGSGPSTENSQPQRPLSNETIVEHLKRCQAIASDYARQTFQYYLQDLDEAFNLAMDKARSNQEVTELSGVQRLVLRNRPELERYYCGYIAEGFVKFKKKELHTKLQSAGEEAELSLVDNDELEETITLSSIVQKVDVHFAEPIWALNQRFAILNGGEQVIEASNPAAPIQLCESLRRALRLIPLTTRAKSIAYKVYEQRLSELTKGIIEDTNTYLKKAGVLPNLRYSPPPSKPRNGENVSSPHMEQQQPGAEHFAGSGEAPTPDPTQPTEQYQSALLQAIRNLQAGMSAGRREAPPVGVGGRRATDGVRVVASGHPFAAYVPAAGDAAGALPPISVEQMMKALQQAQGLARSDVQAKPSMGELTPVDLSQVLATLAEQFGKQQELKESKVSGTDMHTIDLVGMVFEYMLKDENLPDSVKALLSYLHTPFLKLAFVDPGFFEQTEHPARKLLNALAEAGTRWVGNDGTAQHDMYNRIKSVVDAVLKDFKNDVRIITELLLEFNSYTKNIVRRQELMERRAAEKAQGEEKLREVKIRVNEEVRRRIQDEELPSAVLLFALQPWSDYLSFVLLRYGDKSDRWSNALTLLEELVWTIEPKTDAADQARQAENAPKLMQEIESGFETIGYEQVKGQKLIDALNSLVELALQRKKAEPAPAPMRDKLEKIAAEKAGQVSHLSMDISAEEQKVVENLKLIEFGTWFEFEGGKRLKIAWYNSRTSHYMLVDQMGKQVAMMSGVEIAREMIAKRAKIIAGSSKPFFERALENIFQKLNAQAEAQSGDEVHDRQ